MRRVKRDWSHLMKRRWMRLAQVLAVVVVVYFIAAYLAHYWTQVRAYHWSIRPLPLVLSVLAFAVFYLLQGGAWWLLLRGFSLSSDFRRASATWGKSILARYVPGNVFMFLGRAWMSHRQGLDVARVSAAMVYEQALGMASALLTVAILLPFWQYHRGITMLTLVAVPVLVALMHPRVFTPLASRVLRLLKREPLGVALPFPQVLGLLFYYVASWLVAGVASWLLAAAVTGLGVAALPVTIAAYAFAYVVGMAAFVLPSGLGVREAVLAAALAVRLPGSIALAWALLLRLWQTLLELLYVGSVTLVDKIGRTAMPADAGQGGLPATAVSAAAAADGTVDRRSFRRWAWVVIGGMIVFAVVYSLLSWLHYRAYFGGRYDLGNMVQAVYNTAHGHFLLDTNANGVQTSRLGSHVDPIIAFFALPWLVWPSPIMLLVGQAVIVALAAWPAYRLGVRVLKSPPAAAILAGGLLVYPALGFLVLDEFHPVALAVPLLLFAFLYLEEGRFWRSLPFLVLAALCKEEIPLLIVLMGVFFAIRKRRWWPLFISGAAAIYFGLAVGVILPHFNVKGSPFISRYAEYGSSSGAIMRDVILHPVHTVRGLVASADLHYWWRLLWSFALLPLLSPLALLIALPELLINGLSTQVFQRMIQFQYTAGEIPFLFAAVVLGLKRLHGWLTGTRAGGRRTSDGSSGRRAGDASGGRRLHGVQPQSLAVIVFVVALAGNYVLGPLPFSLPGSAYHAAAYERDSHDAVLDQAIKLIPSNATVSVGNTVGSHLSARRVVFTFPYIGNAAYIIVDEQHPFVLDMPNTLGFELALGKVMNDSHYHAIYDRDGVYVFKRVDRP